MRSDRADKTTALGWFALLLLTLLSPIALVGQRTAPIKILDRCTGTIYATPFLTMGGFSTGNEQGLLGPAFHPAYANTGLFCVNSTASNRATGDLYIADVGLNWLWADA